MISSVVVFDGWVTSCLWRPKPGVVRAWTNKRFRVILCNIRRARFLKASIVGVLSSKSRWCMPCEKMPLVNASRMKTSRCSVFWDITKITILTQPPEFLQIFVLALAWFLPGRGKPVPTKHFISSLGKYAVQRYNSTVVGLAFIDILVPFIRQKIRQYLKLVKSRAFILVGHYVVLKAFFQCFHSSSDFGLLISISNTFGFSGSRAAGEASPSWYILVVLIVVSTTQHSQFINVA